MPKKFRFFPLYSGGALHMTNHDEPVIIDIDGWQDEEGGEYPACVQHYPDIIVGKIKPRVARNKDGTPNIIADGEFNDTLQSVFLQNIARTGGHWESSIRTIDPLPTDYEYIAAGDSVTVNGREFLGPCKVLRNWRFQEGSFVFEGADAYNEVTVAAAASSNFPLNLFLQTGQIMTKELRDFIISLGYTEPEQLTPEQFNVAERAFKLITEQQQMAAAAEGETSEEEKNEPCAASAEDTEDEEADPDAGGTPEAAAEPEKAEEEEEKKPVAASANFRTRTNPARSLPRGDVGTGNANTRPTKNEILEAVLLLSAGMNEKAVAASGIGQRAMNEAVSAGWRGVILQQMLLMALEEKTGKRFYNAGACTPEIFEMLHSQANGKNPVAASGGFSTIGALAILNNVLNKTFRERWTNFNSVIDKISQSNTNKDLRKGYFVDYDIQGNLQETGQDGEIKSVTLTSPEIATQVLEWTMSLTLTERMLINDDLGAFARIPKKLARKIRIHREKMAFKKLEDNLSTFCTSARGNVLTSANALNIAGYNAAAAALRLMETDGSTADDPEFTDAEGKFVLVPPALLPTAETLYRDTKCDLIGLGGDPQTNPHVGRYLPISSPYWSSAFNSQTDTQWAMFADPEESAALIVSHLAGQETPRIEQNPTQPNTLGFSWRAVHREGYDLGDYRAIVYSAGTGN